LYSYCNNELVTCVSKTNHVLFIFHSSIVAFDQCDIWIYYFHFSINFSMVFVICSLLLEASHVKTMVITCVKLLNVWTMSICVRLVASTLVLKYWTYLCKKMSQGSNHLSSNTKLAVLIRSVDFTNILLYFFIAYAMLLWIERFFFSPYVSNKRIASSFLIFWMFVDWLWH